MTIQQINRQIEVELKSNFCLPAYYEHASNRIIRDHLRQYGLNQETIFNMDSIEVDLKTCVEVFIKQNSALYLYQDRTRNNCTPRPKYDPNTKKQPVPDKTTLDHILASRAGLKWKDLSIEEKSLIARTNPALMRELKAKEGFQ